VPLPRADASGNHRLRDVLKDKQILLVVGVYFTHQIAVYALSYFLPSIIGTYGKLNSLHIGLLTAIPWIFSAAGALGNKSQSAGRAAVARGGTHRDRRDAGFRGHRCCSVAVPFWLVQAPAGQYLRVRSPATGFAMDRRQKLGHGVDDTPCGRARRWIRRVREDRSRGGVTGNVEIAYWELPWRTQGRRRPPDGPCRGRLRLLRAAYVLGRSP
jgi:hypothetical protein